MEKYYHLLIFMYIISAASAVTVYESITQCFTESKIPATEVSRILYSPQNSSFSNVLESYIRNRRFNVSTTRKPSAIITPTAEPHVSAAVICSKKLGIQLKIRSGGHDYEGLSYTSPQAFVILDMFNFNSIKLDLKDRTAWVDSGAFLGELYHKIWKQSNLLAFPGGVCTTLGIGGHISGGGYGNMMRKYGLTIDNVVDARIVDARGRVVDRKAMGEDLFWAIRGGGGASFGVILAYKIRLVPVPESVTVFRVERGDGIGDQNAVINTILQYQKIAPAIDDDLFVRVLLRPSRSSKSKSSNGTRVTFYGMFLGNAEQLLRITDSQFPLLGLKRGECVEMPWVRSILFWMDMDMNTTSTDGFLLSRSPPTSPDFFRRKSDYLQAPIPKSGLIKLLNVVANGNVELGFNAYGGMMSRIPESATPFPHRAGNLFKIQYAVVWDEEEENAGNAMKYTREIRKVYDFMTPYVSKNPREAFLNYRDLDIGSLTNSNSNLTDTYQQGKVYGLKYFKNNFDKLVEIKTRVDPDNFFRNEQSIPIAIGTKKYD